MRRSAVGAGGERLCQRIKLRSYPLIERAACCGPIWGRRSTSRGCREYEFAWCRRAQRFVSKRLQYCNWLQAMEGGIDSSHVSWLHRARCVSDPLMKGARGNEYNMGDMMPVFEVAENAGGLFIGARRNAERGSYYWRITPWCCRPSP